MNKHNYVEILLFRTMKTGGLVSIKWRIRYWHYVETRSARKKLAPEMNHNTNSVCRNMLLSIIRIPGQVDQEAVMNGDPVQEAPLKPSVAPRVFCFPYRNPLNPSPKPYRFLVALSPPFPPRAQPSEYGGFCFAGPYLG